jgi:DNA-binding response OmpR family regulator
MEIRGLNAKRSLSVSAQARILSIEDHPEMRGLIQLIFERQGYHVISVKSGAFGLEMLKSLRPDVLLLDLMLPDVNGWEIYRQMKEDKDLAHLPVVIVSARSEKKDAKKGNHVIGNDRFVEKPFEIKNLINVVKDALNKEPVNS